jgi:hypothetical protein
MAAIEPEQGALYGLSINSKKMESATTGVEFGIEKKLRSEVDTSIAGKSTEPFDRALLAVLEIAICLKRCEEDRE